MRKHTKITSTERQLLAAWKSEGLSNKECGRRLGRETSTIGRELKHNLFHDRQNGGYLYEPLNANFQAKSRQHAYAAKHPLKSKQVFSYVMEKLRDGWSPLQIAGRLKTIDHPKEKDWQISHEAIYQYIYAPENKEKKLFKYLRRKQKRRRKQHGRSSQRVHIPDRVSIHDRPKSVARRRQFGHWEGDSVVGKGHTSGLHYE